jgi:16S rRNA (cytosine967-C5)-methyltransferase
MNSRGTAAGIIGKWIKTGDFPVRLVDENTADRAFVMEVVSGVARWQRMLEWCIRQCVKGSVDQRAMPYLLVGFYQIFLMDTVTDYAVVNETVNAIKTNCSTHLSGFVNGVLRTALRQKQKITEGLRKQIIGIRESHPDVLVDKWTKQFGEAETVGLCRWNNTRPSVTVHPNLGRITMQDFLSSLKQAGVDATPHTFAPGDFLVLPHGVRVNDLPGYSDGLFSVHDPSTSSAITLLDPRPGEFILDACAAPGGKTVLIAERMKGDGKLVAMDLHQDRLETLKENSSRMRFAPGLVDIVRGDATEAKHIKHFCDRRQFDRILLDVPCTNTGVLRRRPDARWRFSLKRLKEMTTVQRLMLDCVSKFLKSGGVLVYSTCSLEPEECGEMVESWLKEHKSFKLIKSVRTFPPQAHTDGTYAAAITKVSIETE